MHLVQWNVFLLSVLAQTPCCFRSKTEKRLDRGAGLTACAQLEHLAQQHERYDYCRGFKVDRHGTVSVAERCRKYSGYQNCDHAEQITNRDAEPDQRKHVQAAIHDRLPRAYEERPTGPKDHW